MQLNSIHSLLLSALLPKAMPTSIAYYRRHLSKDRQKHSLVYNKKPTFAPKETHIRIMETRKDIAAGKKACGSHNCTQAVCCTYHDFTGIDEETIKHVGNCFAAGMGNMEGTCGALVGAGIVYGLATRNKSLALKGMRQMMEKFRQRNGSTQCKLLKGVGTGKMLRECPLCVADASELLEELLERLPAAETGDKTRQHPHPAT